MHGTFSVFVENFIMLEAVLMECFFHFKQFRLSFIHSKILN